MKKLLLACLLCLDFVAAMAQDSDKKWQFAVGAGASVPLSQFKNYYNTGFGGEVEASYHFNEKFSWYAKTGYNTFSGRTNTYPVVFGGIPFNVEYTSPKAQYIPIIGGPRYRIGNFLVGVAAGVGIYNFKDNGNTVALIGDTSGVSFTYSPEIAYNIGKLKIAASYTSSTLQLDEQFSSFVDLKNATFIGLKLFFRF
jgi:hypothetical protein